MTARRKAALTAMLKPVLSPAQRVGLAVLCMLAWVAGSAWQLRSAVLADAALALGAAVAGFVGIAVAWVGRTRRPRAAAVLALAAALALGWASTHHRADWRLAQALPLALEGQDLLVTGTVADLPREGLQGSRFLFDIEQAHWRGEPVTVPSRVSLGWWRGAEADALLAGPGQAVRAGQRWQFTVRLARPHGAMNPGGFDLELWLFERGLRATGSVREVRGPGQVPARLLGVDPAYPVARLRQAARDAIFQAVPDSRAAGVLAALAVGDQAAIERDDWALFRDTGVAHLMSISGLHVTMFAWMAAALVGALWRRHPRWPLCVPAPVAGRWAGLLLALLYAVVAGWGVPAQRTVAMIAVVVLLRQRGLRWPLPLVLLVAGFGVLLGDPWALLQPGFWLSFVAVGLLAASGAVRAEPAHPQPAPGWAARALQLARSAIGQQVVATVGLAPLSLLFFQQLSLVGFVANLLAIPVVTLVVTPLALLGLLLPPLLTLAALVVQWLQAPLALLAATPMAVWHAAAAPPWAVAAGLLAAFVAVLPWPWRLRLLALPLLLPLLWPAVPRPPPGHFELVAADVGQGTAVLLRTAHHSLVFDTGAAWSPTADAGERVLLPLLRSLGVRELDTLVLSHRDSDHTGGAASLRAALPPRLTLSSLESGHPLREAGAHRPCVAGLAWAWDGVAFELLHPRAETLERAGPATKPNTLSCVLKVTAFGGTGVLLTGDLEAAQEAALVREAPAALASTVLLVPHHGSNTSSTAPFIAAVAPRVAVVQAAHRSRFGHPAPAVLARYAAAGVPLLTTAACGAWTWRSDAPVDAGVPGRCERRERQRYWHHQAAPTPCANHSREAGPELASGPMAAPPGCPAPPK